MRFHHSEEADGQLVVKNEPALLEKDNTRFCSSARTCLLSISIGSPLFFSFHPSLRPPFISDIHTHANINSVPWGQRRDSNHLWLLVVALRDLVVGDVHNPNLCFFFSGLAAKDLRDRKQFNAWGGQLINDALTITVGWCAAIPPRH